MTFRIQVFTLFPEMFPGPLGHSLANKAHTQKVWSLETYDFRKHAPTQQGRVDDAPYGGGPGMVMRADVIADAVEAHHDPTLPLVLLTPRGRRFCQTDAAAFAKMPGIALIAGRYEGIDERFAMHFKPEELSIGDVVLSGGEPAALLVMDAIIRLLPGVMGCAQSAEDESFASGLLECPQYTRPPEWRGLHVPEVLRAGDHQAVARFRHDSALQDTAIRRPDLLEPDGHQRTSKQAGGPTNGDPPSSPEKMGKRTT